MDDQQQIQTRRIQRGNEAGHVLDHPVFIEAIEALRRHNYNQFCQAPNTDDEQRRALWAKKQAIDAVVDQLEEFVRVGAVDVAQREAERLEKRMEKE